jgi:4-hydroxy-3-polyprenylbenzoate decarboxylase
MVELPRLVVGMTGSPGDTVYGVALLEALRGMPVETHAVMCHCARGSVERETGRTPEEVLALADRSYGEWNQAARISSGSFLTLGMVVAPCSSRSLGSIAIGYANNLIHRAADVTVKEGRRLVLLVREAPPGSVDAENVRRLSAVPAVEVVSLPEPAHPSVEAVVHGLLARFDLDAARPGRTGR